MVNFTKLASAGNNLKVWNSSNYSLCSTYSLKEESMFHCVHWSVDSQLISVPTQGEKICFHLVKDKAMKSLDIQLEEICTFANFANTSPRYVGLSTKSNKLLIWDIKDRKTSKLFHVKDEITSLHFNWNDSYVATGCCNGEIVLHHIITCVSGKAIMSKGTEAIRNLQFNFLKRNQLVSASDDGGIRLWDVTMRKLVHHFPAHFTPATSLRFSPDSEFFLISVGLDKKLNLLDTRSKSIAKTLECDAPITALDFKSDGLHVAIGTSRGCLQVFDTRTLKRPRIKIDAHSTSVQSLAFQRESSEQLHSEVVSTSSLSVEDTFCNMSTKRISVNEKDLLPIGICDRKKSLTADIFSPVRGSTSRISSCLMNYTPFGRNTSLTSDSLMTSVTERREMPKRKYSSGDLDSFKISVTEKREMPKRKYSFDVLSPLNDESEHENLKESRKSSRLKSSSAPAESVDIPKIHDTAIPSVNGCISLDELEVDKAEFDVFSPLNPQRKFSFDQMQNKGAEDEKIVQNNSSSMTLKPPNKVSEDYSISDFLEEEEECGVTQRARRKISPRIKSLFSTPDEEKSVADNSINANRLGAARTLYNRMETKNLPEDLKNALSDGVDDVRRYLQIMHVRSCRESQQTTDKVDDVLDEVRVIRWLLDRSHRN